MPDYLALADIVVMPSQHEQQARVYVETQAAERLLLASDIPAAREVIEHGRTGLLFRMGDAGDLAAQTLVAAADPRLRAAIGVHARERVQVHCRHRISARFASALEEVVAVHRRSAGAQN